MDSSHLPHTRPARPSEETGLPAGAGDTHVAAAAGSIGPWKILEKLGEGALGIVYKVEYTSEMRAPMARVGALKLIKGRAAAPELAGRFRAERQALARMNHPNVAKVFDAGADERGHLFFVTEYVAGMAITKFADERRLTIKQRLELFIQVCEAIAHAHSKAIIHRSIKANNVLAYMDGDKPAAKVIDFAVAKAFVGERRPDSILDLDYVATTYETMSPEQADGSPDIDTRTDIYSLGILLYELLGGARPFDPEELHRQAHFEICRIIREVPAPVPSVRLADLGKESMSIAAARQMPLKSLLTELKLELEWIPMMAIHKKRDRRYPTALALSQDVQSYLDGKPLLAGPDTGGYRARKFVQRNRNVVIGGVLAAVAVIAAIGVGVGMIGRGGAGNEQTSPRSAGALPRPAGENAVQGGAKVAAADAGAATPARDTTPEKITPVAVAPANPVLAATEGEKIAALMGQMVTVRGAPTQAAWSSTGKVLNIAFDDDLTHGLLVAMLDTKRAAFDQAFGGDFARAIKGTMIDITGTVAKYGGRVAEWSQRPQIMLDDPSQVKLAGAKTQAQPNAQPAAQVVTIDAADHDALKAAVGKQALVRGKVFTSAWSGTGKVLNISMSGDETTGLLVAIFQENRAKFDQAFGGDFAGAVLGKTVEVSGALTAYGGRTENWKNRQQIILTSPGQVKIVEEPAGAGATAPTFDTK